MKAICLRFKLNTSKKGNFYILILLSVLSKLGSMDMWLGKVLLENTFYRS